MSLHSIQSPRQQCLQPLLGLLSQWINCYQHCWTSEKLQSVNTQRQFWWIQKHLRTYSMLCFIVKTWLWCEGERGGRSLARRLCFGGNLINNHCLCYVQSCIPVIPDYHFTQSLFFRTLQSIQNAAAPPQYTQLWQERSVALLPQMYHNYQYI